MKKITITVEDEIGHRTQMCAAVGTDIVLLDFGLSNTEAAMALSALRRQVRKPIMSLSVHIPSQGSVQESPLTENLVGSKSSLSADTLKTDEKYEKIMLVNGPIRMDTARSEVWVGEQKIALTPREYALLKCFLERQEKLIPHQEILKQVWGEAHINDTQYLRVYMGQLRGKLNVRPGLGKLIVVEAGVGYRMDAAKSLSRAA